MKHPILGETVSRADAAFVLSPRQVRATFDSLRADPQSNLLLISDPEAYIREARAGRAKLGGVPVVIIDRPE